MEARSDVKEISKGKGVINLFGHLCDIALSAAYILKSTVTLPRAHGAHLSQSVIMTCMNVRGQMIFVHVCATVPEMVAKQKGTYKSHT